MISIRVTLSPSDACWQLPLETLRGWPVCLTGWILPTAPLDAGVPAEVGSLLLSPILPRFKVTFPIGQGDLLTTSELKPALRIFETEGFAWDQMAQAAFMSPLDQPAPRVGENDIRAILKQSFDPARLRDAGVSGLLLPAVDGDFAAFTFFEGSLPAFLTAFEHECLNQGAAFEMVPENQFKRTAWYASPLASGLEK